MTSSHRYPGRLFRNIDLCRFHELVSDMLFLDIVTLTTDFKYNNLQRSDYQLELFNGDMGIVLPDPDNQGNLSVFFSRNNKEICSIAPYKLPEHETAYAMTIHKSQGSEFDEVLMVLPEKDTPILTRELIYTGITRARQNLSILSTESAIRLAVSRRIERVSGLRDRLYRLS